MSLATYGLQDILNIIASAYSSAAGTPANIGEGSQLGPIFNSNALAMLLLQSENIYVDSIARLSTMQDPLPTGDPNPDVDTFINQFNFFRNGPSFAQVFCTFSIPSPVSGLTTVPVGLVVSAPGAGPSFQVIPGGPGYDPVSNGYDINASFTSVSAPVQCLVSGSVGNVLANSITQVVSGPGGSTPTTAFSVTNPNAASVPPNVAGNASEVGQPLFNRFALYMSGGGEGTINSIAAGLPIVANSPVAYGNITYSFGDLVASVLVGPTWHFSPQTPGWFTVIANIAGQGVAPPAGLITQIQAGLLNNYRAAGAMFNVIAPTLLTVQMSGVITVAPGFSSASVVQAVIAQATSFVNNIGLNPTGGNTICSLMQSYVALSQVPGVVYIDGLQLNETTNDVSAQFGSQLVSAATHNFTAS